MGQKVADDKLNVLLRSGCQLLLAKVKNADRQDWYNFFMKIMKRASDEKPAIWEQLKIMPNTFLSAYTHNVDDMTLHLAWCVRLSPRKSSWVYIFQYSWWCKLATCNSLDVHGIFCYKFSLQVWMSIVFILSCLFNSLLMQLIIFKLDFNKSWFRWFLSYPSDTLYANLCVSRAF